MKQKNFIVAEAAQPPVAITAQQIADFSRNVVVIDVDISWVFVKPFGTNSAAPFLPR